ncbi:MAG: hypothetical protein JWM07_1 [Candidatus Saccharibacteria bacterium]|nr:hypothetical protein [Candidatus Saccharibacteria bacterium]
MPMDNTHERHDNTAQNESYAYEIGINSVDKVAKQNKGIVVFLNACARTIIEYRHEEFTRMAVLSSYISSVFGGGLDDEERLAIGGAFLKGIVTGACVADQAYDDVVDITDTVATMEAKLGEYSDDSEFYRERGPELIESGHQAQNQMFACNDMIDNWESACVPDIRYHRFYRMGLGIYMASATKAMRDMTKTKDLQIMGDQIEAGGIDWDEEFRNLSND